MKKIFILCSGLILSPSMGFATCTNTTTVPSGYLTTSGPVYTTNCSSIKEGYVCDSELGTSGVCYPYHLCNACASGYSSATKTITVGCMDLTYLHCYDPNCYAGTYKNSSGACTSCSVGTYSDSTNASSCTTCPALSGAYGDSARSKAVNVANGYVTTAGTGSKSINDCYIINASYYYDTSGTFSFGGTCAYDGTVVADKCPASSISGACLSSGGTTGVVVDGEKTNDMTGAHC